MTAKRRPFFLFCAGMGGMNTCVQEVKDTSN